MSTTVKRKRHDDPHPEMVVSEGRSTNNNAVAVNATRNDIMLSSPYSATARPSKHKKTKKGQRKRHDDPSQLRAATIPDMIVSQSETGTTSSPSPSTLSASTTTSTSSHSPDPPPFELSSPIPKLLVQTMMLDHKDQPTLLANDIEMLNDLMVESHNNMVEAQQFGAHSIVITLMNQYMKNEDIQVVGCSCLGPLSYLNQSEINVIKAGGVQTCLAAMCHFPNSVGVQYFALKALKNMINGDKKAPIVIKEITNQFVMEWNGIILMKQAMIAHHADSQTLMTAYEIFSWLAKNTTYLQIMMQEGIGSIVMKTLERYNINNSNNNIINDEEKSAYDAAKKCLGVLFP